MSKDDTQLMETARQNLRRHGQPAESSAAPFAERFADWLLGGPLTVVLVGLCGFQLATWIPHYLTWPWFADHDVFATMAIGWEHGLRPYRDLAGNNFPGTLYLFWVIGKLFGWGRTVPFYALDVACVMVQGAALLAWSRARFGRFLPGIAGFAAFLSYYLSLDFSRAAQRDWHGPFLMMTGLLLVDGFPARWSRRLSMFTTAAAFVVRPQVVLFLPALGLALARGVRSEPGEGAAAEQTDVRTAPALLGWGVGTALLIALGFMPLALGGSFGDFLRGIGLTLYGARYNTAHSGSILYQMLLQLLHLEYDLVPLAILVLAPLADAASRRSAAVWMLGYLGAWVYKPLSPVPFPYLEHPLALVWAIGIGMLVQLAMTRSLARPALRLIAVALAIGLGVHARPLQCSVGYARQAIATLRQGVDPVQPPLGIHIEMPVNADTLAFPWNDYRDTLAYLRSRTSADTQVANLLHVVPALNGPSGRSTFLPAESLAWLGVAPGSESAFARALEHAPAGSLVVWTPEKGEFFDLYRHYDEVERLAPIIRRHFVPLARFGDVAIWQHTAGRAADERVATP